MGPHNPRPLRRAARDMQGRWHILSSYERVLKELRDATAQIKSTGAKAFVGGSVRVHPMARTLRHTEPASVADSHHHSQASSDCASRVSSGDSEVSACSSSQRSTSSGQFDQFFVTSTSFASLSVEHGDHAARSSFLDFRDRRTRAGLTASCSGASQHMGRLEQARSSGLRAERMRTTAKQSGLYCAMSSTAWGILAIVSVAALVPTHVSGWGARAHDTAFAMGTTFRHGLLGSDASVGLRTSSYHLQHHASGRGGGVLGLHSMLSKRTARSRARFTGASVPFLLRGDKSAEEQTSLSASTITGWQQTSEDDFSGPLGVTKFVGECDLPTDKGLFRLRSYSYQGMKIVDRNGEKVQEYVEMEPVIIYKGNLRGSEQAVVRVHDQCFTSEVMGSKRCDCKEQLDLALDYIQEHGGALVYMPQEGRGIGLAYKVAAYELQDSGLDTVDANRHLGFGDDERSYACIPYMLKDLGVRGIQLVTNNPMKIMQLRDLGVNIVGRRPSLVAANKYNENYLRTKASRMAHAISFDEEEAQEATAHAEQQKGEQTAAAMTTAQTRRRFGALSVSQAVSAMSKGRPVVVMDAEGSSEGAKLCVAAGEASTATVTMLMQHGGGQLQAAMAAAIHQELVKEGPSLRFTESSSPGGFSPADRTVTLKQLASPSAKAHFFSTPGHVVPARVGEGKCETVAEAAVALAGLCGLRPVVACSELVRADRLALMSSEEVLEMARDQQLVVTSVEDIAHFAAHCESP